MNTATIHEDITKILYKIEEQYSQILQQTDKISTLDVDLAIKDIRYLYECFLDLRELAEYQRKQSGEIKQALTEPVSQELKEPKPLVVAEKSDAKPDASSQKTEKEIKKPESVQPAPIAWQKTFDASQAPPDDLAKPSITPVNIPDSSEIPPQVTAPKVDLLKEREKDFVPTVRKIEFKPEPVSPDPKKESIFEKAASLYDKIAKPVEKTIGTQASKQPISNIKSAIGINEKFSYLKDLFKNNINEYHDALDKLNNFENYADAEDFFQELKIKYNWDTESKSFIGLADLLSRRYLHNV